MSDTDATPSWTLIRSELANVIRRDPDDPRVPILRRQLRAARLTEHVQKSLEAAPPLTDEQRASIARLLIGGGSDAA
jgi:hypothetical protein